LIGNFRDTTFIVTNEYRSFEPEPHNFTWSIVRLLLALLEQNFFTYNHYTNNTMTDYASEGFDLDAVQAGEGEDVIYEIGGGATVEKVSAENNNAHAVENNNNDDDPMALEGIDRAEAWKKQGNEQFKQGNYLEAYDLYTEAIEACPGELKGKDILKLKAEFLEEQREKLYRIQRQAAEERNKARQNREAAPAKDAQLDQKPQEYALPPQPHAEKLAIYYGNRGATLLHLDRLEEAVEDCDLAILINPKYVKAFVRRSAAQERLDKTDEALGDAKKALELEPSNLQIRKNVSRLQKIEDERLEKLKTETIGKFQKNFIYFVIHYLFPSYIFIARILR
jgi:tetratricopeptide (TPR) repeat protein